MTTKAEKGIIEAAKKEKRRHVLRKWFKKKRVGELGEESHRIVSRVDGAALVGRDCRGERVWGRFFFVSNRLFFLMMSGKCVRLVFENVPAKENAGMKEDGRPLSFSLKRGFLASPSRWSLLVGARSEVFPIARASSIHRTGDVSWSFASQPLSFLYLRAVSVFLSPHQKK